MKRTLCFNFFKACSLRVGLVGALMDAGLVVRGGELGIVE